MLKLSTLRVAGNGLKEFKLQLHVDFQSVNASMPYVMSNYLALYLFLRSQQQNYQYYDRVWVQHIDMINRCTVFTYQRVEADNCQRLSPFLCEIGE
jgi:hypothetical protein